MKFTRSGVLAILFATGAAALLALLVLEQRHAAEIAAGWESAKQELRASEARLGEVEQENRSLRTQLEAEGLEPRVAAPVARPANVAKLETVRELAALQTRYEALQEQFVAVQNRLGELEGALEKLTNENRRLSGGESSLRDQLDSNRRVITAMEAELRSKAVRVDQLEESLRRVRDQASGTDRRSAQITQAVKQLEDINRRREDTLNALQRRYRDVTDQLRSLSLRMDTQRDSPDALGVTDISRITSAVQSAEEDLRTLVSLNTQARNAIDRLTQ
jgi:chromosome segregation ATPase